MLARKLPTLIVSEALVAMVLVCAPYPLLAQGYDTKLDEGGVDKRLDHSGVDKDLDESGIDKRLDDSGIDNPAAAQQKPTSSGPEIIHVPESASD